MEFVDLILKSVETDFTQQEIFSIRLVDGVNIYNNIFRLFVRPILIRQLYSRECAKVIASTGQWN